MKFQFPFVTRKEYDPMVDVAAKLCARVIALEDERDAIIGRAAELADIERKDRATEREHVEANINNLPGGQ